MSLQTHGDDMKMKAQSYMARDVKDGKDRDEDDRVDVRCKTQSRT